QPWIIYNIMLTADAVTKAGIVRPFFGAIVIIYVIIAVATVATLRVMSRRWASGDTSVRNGPYAPLDGARDSVGAPPVAVAAGSREDV
ncbi:MAG TPA: hypothetical protein VFB50_21625, partial [Chloroflexota bacterium]|nr:hypothetical protein [Chloroflexota bacterium]